MPCLERLNLQGNPVTSVLDYRTTMFELFGERAGEVFIRDFCCTVVLYRTVVYQTIT
jgi:hypothetical protein